MGCIYGFFDRNGRVFYVGQTRCFNSRKANHRGELERGNKLYSYNKLRKEITETSKPFEDFVLVIEDNVSDDKLDEREIYHISAFRSLGYKLTNLTNGGRGALGYTSAQQKASSKKRIGQKRSEETRRKISESRKGIVFSDVHKKNLSKARTVRVISQETRFKTSDTSKGKINIKVFSLVAPDGTTLRTTEGLTKFCEDRCLSRTQIIKLLNGKIKEWYGWRVTSS